MLSWKQLLEVGRKQEEKELEARSVIMIFPDAQEISRDPREIARAEVVGGGCHPLGGSPNSSQVLVEYGHSLHHQSFPRECIGKSFSV